MVNLVSRAGLSFSLPGAQILRRELGRLVLVVVFWQHGGLVRHIFEMAELSSPSSSFDDNGSRQTIRNLGAVVCVGPACYPVGRTLTSNQDQPRAVVDVGEKKVPLVPISVLRYTPNRFHLGLAFLCTHIPLSQLLQSWWGDGLLTMTRRPLLCYQGKCLVNHQVFQNRLHRCDQAQKYFLRSNFLRACHKWPSFQAAPALTRHFISRCSQVDLQIQSSA